MKRSDAEWEGGAARVIRSTRRRSVHGVDLRRVFARVPRVGLVDGCTYCYSKSDLKLLGGNPAKVPDHLVGAFAREVTEHWSEQQYGLVWRALAPRILDLLEAVPDERMLHGLTFAHFAMWPAEEQAAVRHRLRAMLTHAITGGANPCDMENLVCAAAHVDRDLTPWLRFLDTLTGPDTDAGIARLARHWADDLAAGGEPMLWWYPEDPAAPIRDWLHSDTLHQRLSRMNAQDTLIAIAQI